MADKNTRFSDNVPGKFYVCANCTGCSTCTAIAPESLEMSEDASHARVYKQPESEEEIMSTKEAMELCPNNAIGDDGE